MQDPIGSFLRIRELYISYLDTAFRIADLSVAAERRRLLRSPGTLCTEPLLEPMPRYEAAAVAFHELPELIGSDKNPLKGFGREEIEAFVELVLSGLFPSKLAPSELGLRTRRVGNFNPYSHQVSMLERGARPGSPGIVTSGTGSGKTESFLLPLFAALTKEAKHWPKPATGYLSRRWWHDPTTKRPYGREGEDGILVPRYESIPKRMRPLQGNPKGTAFRPHREGETRDAAVRALVLYPMNALVEDQMVRLRKALDSLEAREMMEREFDGNRIFFGRYTSKTPVTGHEDHPGLSKLLDYDDDDPDLDRIVDWLGGDADSGGDGRTLREIRKAEIGRRARRQKELFTEMVSLEEGQRRARIYEWLKRNEGGDSESVSDRAPSAFGDDTPFMFPSVDGCELISRWDMQRTPPDVLITNVSMLSAMLTREVDRPIFDSTRAWLQKPDSYFYLVLDELHLQRGSSGTEVAYLLRLLLDRLGLSSQPQRHKLRILASSASLPSHPAEEAQKSADYLWDMFGRFGLPTDVDSEERGRRLWLESIIAGKERRAEHPIELPARLNSEPFIKLLEDARRRQGQTGYDPLPEAVFAVDPRVAPEVENLWRDVASALGADGGTDIAGVVEQAVARAASHLAAACWDASEQRSRATTLRRIAWLLFWDIREARNRPEDTDYDRALLAVRALLFVRGCGDGLTDLLGSRVDAPAFRVHTFFRNLEGLYAPAWRSAGMEEPVDSPERKAEVGRLSIEREARKEFEIPGVGRRSLRQLELLYCECCGELFFGGMRSTRAGGRGGFGGDILTELLPHEAQIDGLPDASVSQRFEELSHEQYALFWPTDALPRATNKQRTGDLGVWREALLERETGVIKKMPDARSRTSTAIEGIRGFIYELRSGTDRHGRKITSPETHVPYTCPKCNSDYYRRQQGMGRLSPLRNFRAGFGKTTQLLATELFDAQRVANPSDDAKLVSFSDSRQDAARAALDIESNHHQDLRRELLVVNLHKHLRTRRSPAIVEAERDEAQQAMEAAMRARDLSAVGRELERAERLEAELEECREPSVALSSVVERRTGWDASGEGMKTSPLVADMVRRGVHPYDEAGIDKPVGLSDDGKRRWFEWDTLFDVGESGVFWRDDARRGSALHTARRNLVFRFHQATTDVIFSKTYFSLEEAGLGYATLREKDLPKQRHDEQRIKTLSALTRVLTDAYRYWPSKYRKDDDKQGPWLSLGDVRNEKVMAFAEAVWGSAAGEELMLALADLSDVGHAGGVIELDKVRIKLTDGHDTYWRCRSCARVHLHGGAGVCTRCFEPLLQQPDGSVAELHRSNFLARRVLRALGHEFGQAGVDTVFRLHCEELTGQTEDPARRQREFRGIFVPEILEDDSADEVTDVAAGAKSGEVDTGEDPDSRYKVVKNAFEAKETIDVLAVTTTMEVGIDIGPLQVVLQANMPPQRFNYQQRVGRAGRRGQAFSMALTICRTRSHDIYYFREPQKMTGDVPPTPFLTKKMSNIAERFLRKQWLVNAFDRLRREERSVPYNLYPGDLMTPPDIHGEFMPVALFRDTSRGWRRKLGEELAATQAEAAEFLDLLALDGRLEAHPSVDAEALAREIDDKLDDNVAYGLGHTLAELGLFPMFGMPTRVRELYLGIRMEEHKPTALTIDRDLDVAIYEFAPGAKVVKDKYEHLCVGFTPSIGLPEFIKRGKEVDARSFNEGPFGEHFFMAQCGTCGAWMKLREQAEAEHTCEACAAIVSGSNSRECVVPNAFRTDFKPKPKKEEGLSGSRHRSIQAEGRKLEFSTWDLEEDGSKISLNVAFDERSRTYRLNRGPEHDEDVRGFSIEHGGQTIPMGAGTLRLPSQAIDSEADLHGFQTDGAEQFVWLAAPKTTDSIYLASPSVYEGLALHKLPARSDDPDPLRSSRWQGVRAAALSSTFLVANRASLELDIDPAELEVLEPRPYGRVAHLPLLQITDQLVNGAGFCRNLSELERGVPKVLHLIKSMLSDPATYPLESFFREEHRDCDTACYRCLLRYGNQQYHGLLDWRLALSYLRAMVDPNFTCGLDGNFSYPELERWQQNAASMAEEMVRRFGGEVGSFAGGTVPAFRVKLGRGAYSRWVLVAHPLWDWSDDLVEGTILSRAEEEASSEGAAECWDTFNLARRQVQVREWMRG